MIWGRVDNPFLLNAARILYRYTNGQFFQFGGLSGSGQNHCTCVGECASHRRLVLQEGAAVDQLCNLRLQGQLSLKFGCPSLEIVVPGSGDVGSLQVVIQAPYFVMDASLYNHDHSTCCGSYCIFTD